MPLDYALRQMKLLRFQTLDSFITRLHSLY